MTNQATSVVEDHVWSVLHPVIVISASAYLVKQVMVLQTVIIPDLVAEIFVKEVVSQENSV